MVELRLLEVLSLTAAVLEASPIASWFGLLLVKVAPASSLECAAVSLLSDAG